MAEAAPEPPTIPGYQSVDIPRYEGYQSSETDREARDSLGARVPPLRRSSVSDHDGSLIDPIDWCNGLCQRWLIVFMGLIVVGIFLGLIVGASVGSGENPKCTSDCCATFCCMICHNCSVTYEVDKHCNRTNITQSWTTYSTSDDLLSQTKVSQV